MRFDGSAVGGSDCVAEASVVLGLQVHPRFCSETRELFRLVLRFVGAALVMVAAAVALWLGVYTERKSLEDVATPLTAETPEHA